MRGNQPVPLQPKAFETLLALVQHSEGVVLKDDIMKSVWPDTFVEESNLMQNIFVLRKALGERGSEQRYILTVPGRGYRFVQKVRVVPAAEEAGNLVIEPHSPPQVVTAGLAALPLLRIWPDQSASWIVTCLFFGRVSVGDHSPSDNRSPNRFSLTAKGRSILATLTIVSPPVETSLVPNS